MTNSISSHSIRSSQKRRVRRLPTAAEKVLDAPGLVDDYCKLQDRLYLVIMLEIKQLPTFVLLLGEDNPGIPMALIF